MEPRRERKRRETYERIAQVAIKLFLKLGYDATTMDAIAEAADVSRRSLFDYFASKEDVLFAYQERFRSAVMDEIRAQPQGLSWPVLIESALARAIAEAATPENIALDELVRNTPALQSRYQLKYVYLEQAIASALGERSGGDELSRRKAELLAAVVVAGFRIGAKASNNARLQGNAGAQRSVPQRFQRFWQSLYEFGEEGLAHHQHRDAPSERVRGIAGKKAGQGK